MHQIAGGAGHRRRRCCVGVFRRRLPERIVHVHRLRAVRQRLAHALPVPVVGVGSRHLPDVARLRRHPVLGIVDIAGLADAVLVPGRIVRGRRTRTVVR